jgi:hypothetical protein
MVANGYRRVHSKTPPRGQHAQSLMMSHAQSFSRIWSSNDTPSGSATNSEICTARSHSISKVDRLHHRHSSPTTRPFSTNYQCHTISNTMLVCRRPLQGNVHVQCRGTAGVAEGSETTDVQTGCVQTRLSMTEIQIFDRVLTIDSRVNAKCSTHFPFFDATRNTTLNIPLPLLFHFLLPFLLPALQHTVKGGKGANHSDDEQLHEEQKQVGDPDGVRSGNTTNHPDQPHRRATI